MDIKPYGPSLPFKRTIDSNATEMKYMRLVKNSQTMPKITHLSYASNFEKHNEKIIDPYLDGLLSQMVRDRISIEIIKKAFNLAPHIDMEHVINRLKFVSATLNI